MQDNLKFGGSILVLVGIVCLVLTPAILGLEQTIQREQTRDQVKNIAKTLCAYISEDGYYVECNKQYEDVWGNPITIEYIGEPGRKLAFIVTSYGVDGKFCTPDDIVEIDRLSRQTVK